MPGRVNHEADVCVVGGGMAGLCAAVSAARRGARVVLMHDRPVLGGNASSECRVHICGADRHNRLKHLRETGILEELRLENLRHNPHADFSLWDLVLYEAATREPRVSLLLNCSCVEAQVASGAVQSVTGWQMTTQTWHTVSAFIFVDCSGDGILAPLSGAEFRMGREGRDEFGESLAPEHPDTKTMGMTCLFEAREYPAPQKFEPPAWAYRYDRCEELPYGEAGHRWYRMGYWWVELGGEQNTIADAETVRDELLKICLGVWDHIKNRCPHRDEAARWALEWLQFLPAKRESRRYVTLHTLSQKDIESGGRFPDTVAYGGWSMDDHHPAGFHAVRIGAPPTLFHRAPSPYGIPYRCLVSKTVRNLMCAGRDAGCTHIAMSSTRVMGTGCSMGQAVGTAAAMAVRKGCLPHELLPFVGELQQTLLADDAYLPGVRQEFSALTRAARLTSSQGDPEPVRDGWNRQIGDDPHAWQWRPGDWISYCFPAAQDVREICLILDSGLDLLIQMSRHQRDDQLRTLPPCLPRALLVEGKTGGNWHTLYSTADNHHRLVRIPVDHPLEGVRATLRETWGDAPSRLYAFWVE